MSDLPETPKSKRAKRMPATGPGWGGEKKGGGRPKNADGSPNKAPFQRGNQFGAIPADQERVAIRKARSWEMECLLEDLAHNAEFEQTRLNAAKSLHAIDAGLPTARIEAKLTRTTEELSDAELLEIAQRSGSS